ncbi:MAG: Gfo/Idh/MocA family oxidoreductase [Planctomycetota bacterium]
MPPSHPLRLGVLGCGNISKRYCDTLKPYPQHARPVAFYDLLPDRAAAYATEFGGEAVATIDQLLGRDDVDAVLNLTIHTAHFATTKAALEAGKHVLSEKPLALTYAEAKQLCELAEAKGVTLSGAPMTFMGEAQQTTWKQVRGGVTGTPRLVYAEVNQGRIEAWHPAPGPFYAVGPLWDVGVYPLTLATTFFGPAARVAAAYQTTLFPHRQTLDGTAFTIEAPEFITAVIELASGVTVRLTTNFYVQRNNTTQGSRFEVHGDAGSVSLGSFQDFHADVQAAPLGQDLEPVAPVRTPYEGIEWARSIVELSEALDEGRSPRVTGRQAAHVVEIIETIYRVAERHQPAELTSTFDPPSPMPWAE